MTWFDIFVVGVMLISLWIGIMRGFVKEILTIFSFVIAVVVALYGHGPLYPFIEPWVPDALIGSLATGTALFVVSYYGAGFMAAKFAEIVKNSKAGTIDRGVGAIFGLIRGALLIFLLVIGSRWFYGQEQLPDEMQGARTWPYVEQGEKIIYRLAPSQWQDFGENNARQAAEKARQSKSLLKILSDDGLLPPELPNVNIQEAEEKGYKKQINDQLQQLLDQSETKSNNE